jgi:glutathione S-transferase
MLVLCGFAVSNYYNKVKLALLEKGVPFTEELARTGKDVTPELLLASPLGKIPFLKTPSGSLCESQVIMDYLESAHPSPALLPADPWQAAKLRELITFMELHLELVARDLYGAAFFGGSLSDTNRERVYKLLTRNIAAFRGLSSFEPFMGGGAFSMADCAAIVHLPVIGMATKTIFGTDLLQEVGIDWKGYTKRFAERPSVARVNADRKLFQDAMKAK